MDGQTDDDQIDRLLGPWTNPRSSKTRHQPIASSSICRKPQSSAHVVPESDSISDSDTLVTNQQILSKVTSNCPLKMIPSLIAKLLMGLLAMQSATAFAPSQRPLPTLAPLEASAKPLGEKISQAMTTAAVVVATSPLAALAEEVDDYEYGAVDAPIGIAWAGGVLAVLTALLPLALQGGEEAFEEMKDRDSGSWGSGQTDALNRNRRR